MTKGAKVLASKTVIQTRFADERTDKVMDVFWPFNTVLMVVYCIVILFELTNCNMYEQKVMKMN